MEIIILFLAMLSFSMLVPIFLHDIFGIKFYKKETAIAISKKELLSNIKTKLSKMKIKIKIDYLLIFFLFFALLLTAVLLITKNGDVKMSKIWQWIITLVVGLVTIYLIARAFKTNLSFNNEVGKKVASKVATLSKKVKNLSWWKKILWTLITIILTFLVFLVLYFWNDIRGLWKHKTPTNSSSGFPGVKTYSSGVAEFSLSGENQMTPDERKLYCQQRTAPYHFAPSGSDTVVYTIVKGENSTRNWTVKVWVKDGVLHENRQFEPEPNNEAKVGDSYISVNKPCKMKRWPGRVVSKVVKVL